MHRSVTIIFFFLLITIAVSKGQSLVKDSVLKATILHFNYTYQIPGADMADRFGNSSNIGAGVLFKMKKNWLLGGEANFQFGKKVKEDDILDPLLTKDATLISQEGLYGDYLFSQRAYMLRAKFGKIFSFERPNPNSGIMALFDLGFFQHKILIDVEKDILPQLDKEMRRGYDRLSNGLMLSQMIGYFFLDPNKLLNFYAGVEVVQGFTQNRRSWNYDTNSKDDAARLDLLYGIKLGFMIPIYKSPTEEYYYY